MIFDQNISILTIDDDIDLLEMINSILVAEGYRVHGCSSRDEALEYLLNLPKKNLPQLILLDFTMPGLSGQAFHHELLSHDEFKDIPIVLMTANTNLHQIMDEFDADAYISKPMDAHHILHVAKNFTERRQNARHSFLT
jgi:two-component system alkaline phosphatase synthesis response regulator PhoP